MEPCSRSAAADSNSGTAASGEALLPLVYDQLRELASHQLAKEKPDQTLQATALVHEAFLRLSSGGEVQWNGREHFFATAAQAMRRILVDRARQKNSQKRGGKRKRLALDEAVAAAEEAPADFLDLNDALSRLEDHDCVKSDLVKLRFFAGLTLDDAAKVLGISPATADRYWAYARVWLFNAVFPKEIPGNSKEP